MRIQNLEIKNFRGIKALNLSDLQSTIVVVGANGSGKSCIFDAIRLLKSAYGGYQQNEWHHWISEFNINFQNDPESLLSFFQDRTQQMSITCAFQIHPDERQYLQDHGEELVRQSVWRLLAPELYAWNSYIAAPMAAQFADREQEVLEATKQQYQLMLQELSRDTIVGRLFCNPGQTLQFQRSKALEIIFSAYQLGKLGLIDYHGPQRMYTREIVTGISLDLNAAEQQYRQHALYNYNIKYTNVKSEMAASYVKEILAEKAGVPPPALNTLSTTLDELFSTFFPDKKFLGPRPTIDGGLTFHVQTADGARHDLNELSAGEKEILYGYLRIRNSAPRYSIILIDEPELHLNPRLVRGLPHFYHQHLGKALDNQIWLITHSDALLREVVGRPEYSVYHMVSASSATNVPQIRPLGIGEDLERAVLSLVGDLAAYRPGKKIVIFEGGGDSEFDQYMASTLFPRLAEGANILSGGNKLRVRELHSVLDAAAQAGNLPFKIFSVTDKDAESTPVASPRYAWDVYHIENYLLEPKYIGQVLRDLGIYPTPNESEIYERLRAAARTTLNSLIRHELTRTSNISILQAINIGCDPNAPDIAKAIFDAVERSAERVSLLKSEGLALENMRKKQEDLYNRYLADLGGDAWRGTFRGRDILREFFAAYSSFRYEAARNLIIARMRDEAFEPTGMKTVIEEILRL